MKIREARTQGMLAIAVIAVSGLAAGCTPQFGGSPSAHQTVHTPSTTAAASTSSSTPTDPPSSKTPSDPPTTSTPTAPPTTMTPTAPPTTSTPSTPSDPPTTSTPTDPPTTAAPSSTPTGPACVTSSNNGSCGPYKFAGITASNGFSTFVSNDVWNPISGTSQTMTATSPGTWSAVAHMTDGNTAVVSYPNTNQIFTTTSNAPAPLSSFSKIVSTFAESMPDNAQTSAEWGFDVWSGQSNATDGADEMMIWTDTENRGTCGGATMLTTASFGGSNGVPVQTWTLCRNGAAGPRAEYIWYLAGAQESSGTVDILSMENWLVTKGYYPAGTGINQIDFGTEICSTGGTPETFSLNAYTLTTS